MNLATMSSKSPIFPMPQPQHFSDYGFDPQIDYFQVLEEARKHKRESTTTRSIDSIHFKLQKPISKDDTKRSQNKKKRWWRGALLFFKWKWIRYDNNNHHRNTTKNGVRKKSCGGYEDVHQARARAFRASISGPVYITESRSGPTTPRRSSGRPAHSGPLAGTLSPAESDEMVGIPYVSLRQLNMEQQQQRRLCTSATPIYLVT